jgi:FkbM family methyltransferase
MTGLIATPEDLRAAYRLLLGREPDEVGFEHHLKRIREESLTTAELCAEFLASPEHQAEREAGMKVDIGGGVFAIVNPLEREFGRHIARNGTWEAHIVEVIRANLSKGHVFVDVGANVGVMSFNAAHEVGPHGKVIAFEPNEENARLFLQGVRENGFQKFIRLYHFALSDHSDLFALEGGSNTHLVRGDALRRPLVQSVRGDELLASERDIRFIKLDIEGHEPFAITGLSETISRHKPIMLCEFNPRCLKDHIGVPPKDFAVQLFSLTDLITVIEYDGRKKSVHSVSELLDFWVHKNQEAVEMGLLPDGMLHFDLLFHANR